jgi:hypothetical protein
LQSTILFGIDKVVKYDIDMPFWTGTFVWVMNNAKYAAMSPAQRTVIDHRCTTEWAKRIANPWADREHAGRTRIMVEPGHEVYPLPPEQLAAWHKAAEPLKAKWASQVKDADAVFAALEAELKQRGALAQRGNSTKPLPRCGLGPRRSDLGRGAKRRGSCGGKLLGRAGVSTRPSPGATRRHLPHSGRGKPGRSAP